MRGATLLEKPLNLAAGCWLLALYYYLYSSELSLESGILI